MKTIFILLLLSIGLLAGDRDAMLVIELDSVKLEKEFSDKLRNEVKGFLKNKNYDLSYEYLITAKVDKSKCKYNSCNLALAEKNNVNKLIIIKISKIDDKINFSFKLFDFNLEDVYRTKYFYNGKFNFIHIKLEELFERNQKDINIKYKNNPSKKQKISKEYNKVNKGLREAKPWGFHASAGGSPVIGFVLDSSLSENIRVELSFIAGWIPIVLGLKYYFTPNHNFSPYMAVHGTVYGFYAPIGIEYMANNGFTISVEAGILVVPEFSSDVTPWGGLKLGYRF